MPATESDGGKRINLERKQGNMREIKYCQCKNYDSNRARRAEERGRVTGRAIEAESVGRVRERHRERHRGVGL